MRDYNDRGNGLTERWDADVEHIHLTPKPMNVRLVGLVQDIAIHWCFLKAGDHADKLSDLKSEARRRGREFKRPKDPPGVPFLCPKFDLYREKIVQWQDPSGNGFLDSEVLTPDRVSGHGIKIPASMKDAERFSPLSLKAGKAIPVTKLYCPQHDDFNRSPQIRTWWHGIAHSAGGTRFGIIGKGGLPFTAMLQIRRIAKNRRGNPADSDNGYMLSMSMDPTQPSQLMYSITDASSGKESPLTPKEKATIFGRYMLADGTKATIIDVLRLRKEDPTRLEGMKVVKEAAMWPLEDMARAAVSSEGMKEFMVQQGFYDENGKPRPELIVDDADTGNKKASNGADDDDDDDDRRVSGKNRSSVRAMPEDRPRPTRRRKPEPDPEPVRPRRKKKKSDR